MGHADLGGQYGLSRLGCHEDPPRQGCVKPLKNAIELAVLYYHGDRVTMV